MKRNNAYFFVASIMLLFVAFLSGSLREIEAVPKTGDFEALPDKVGDYGRLKGGGLRGNFFSYDADTSLLTGFVNEGHNTMIFVYVGYWEKQNDGRAIRSPRYTTDGWGYHWIRTKNVPLAVDGNAAFKAFLNERGNEKELVYYAYIIDGKVIPDEYRYRFRKALNSLLYRKNNAALIRVSTPITPDVPLEEAEAHIEDFLREFLPIVLEHLPK